MAFNLVFTVISICAITFSAVSQPVDRNRQIKPVGIAPVDQDGYGNGSNQLAQPDDVEFLRDGSILVTDVNNNRLQLFSAGGKFLKSITAGELNLTGDLAPTGISQDAEGFIYVSLEDAGTIARLKPDLTLDRFIGVHCDIRDTEYYCPENSNCLLNPQGLLVSKNGDVFVIDMNKSFRRGAQGKIRNFGFRKFRKTVSGGKTDYVYDTGFARTQEITKVMRKSEGMAIDEERGIIFVAEEKPLTDEFKNKKKHRFVAAFDMTTGKFLDRLYGVNYNDGKINDGVFNESIEGVTVYRDYLFAVDEKNGCIRAFDIDSGDYLGFWGHPAPFYCDDESDCIIDGKNFNEQAIMAGKVFPHLKNDWRNNELASPDGIAVYTSEEDSDRLGVVDQWNSRIVLYDLDQIVNLLSEER